jgi:hypothetical protein
LEVNISLCVFLFSAYSDSIRKGFNCIRRTRGMYFNAYREHVTQLKFLAISPNKPIYLSLPQQMLDRKKKNYLIFYHSSIIFLDRIEKANKSHASDPLESIGYMFGYEPCVWVLCFNLWLYISVKYFRITNFESRLRHNHFTHNNTALIRVCV